MRPIPRPVAVLPVLLVLSSCATRLPVRSAAGPFRVQAGNGALYLKPPDASPVLFSELLERQYHFDLLDGFVDLTGGMRLHILQATLHPGTRPDLDDAFFRLVRRRNRELRLVRVARDEGQAPPKAGPAALTVGEVDRLDRYVRLFFLSKFVKAAGEPVRSGLILWARTPEEMAQRTALLHRNPDASCTRRCVEFPGLVTVEPQVLVFANGSPRYVTLGATVRSILQAAHAPAEPPSLQVSRLHLGQLKPVVWNSPPEILSLPLFAGDRIDW